MYWYASPGATQWTGPYWFNLASDRDSTISTTSTDRFGNTYTSQTSDCNL